MPRGKKLNSARFMKQYNNKEIERLQNAQIEKMEALVRDQTLQQNIQALVGKEEHVVKNYKLENTITLPSSVQYAAIDLLPNFTVNELGAALKLSSFIDMSDDLNSTVSMSDMLERFSNNCQDSEFRIYLRNAHNFKRFAILQNVIETMYSIENQEDLQGWILHFGTMFVFGGVRFSLEESIERIQVAIQNLCAQMNDENDISPCLGALKI
jgi:hypothetical protein